MYLYPTFFKPILDRLIAVLGLLVISPVFVVISIILYYVNNGSVFFRQKRPGLHERIFTLIKFKTMNDKKDANGNLLPDAKRLTSAGRFIRSTSLDELPQLLNVLKGDMSLVGPRPLLPKYLERYTPEQARRHLVKPGITGWAQVNGRNTLSWEQKFTYDVEYVDNISFLFDLKIIYLTLIKVCKREGISSSASATMEEFKPE